MQVTYPHMQQMHSPLKLHIFLLIRGRKLAIQAREVTASNVQAHCPFYSTCHLTFAVLPGWQVESTRSEVAPCMQESSNDPPSIGPPPGFPHRLSSLSPAGRKPPLGDLPSGNGKDFASKKELYSASPVFLPYAKQSPTSRPDTCQYQNDHTELYYPQRQGRNSPGGWSEISVVSPSPWHTHVSACQLVLEGNMQPSVPSPCQENYSEDIIADLRTCHPNASSAPVDIPEPADYTADRFNR